MRFSKDYVFTVDPWSWPAFVAALLALAVAAAVQEMLVAYGATLYFAAFFPAIFVASLVAGAPAGIFAAVLAVPIVWWAFMPPYFEFNLLTTADYDRFFVFLLLSSLMIRFSHLYREARAMLRQ